MLCSEALKRNFRYFRGDLKKTTAPNRPSGMRFPDILQAHHPLTFFNGCQCCRGYIDLTCDFVHAFCGDFGDSQCQSLLICGKKVLWALKKLFMWCLPGWTTKLSSHTRLGSIQVDELDQPRPLKGASSTLTPSSLPMGSTSEWAGFSSAYTTEQDSVNFAQSRCYPTRNRDIHNRVYRIWFIFKPLTWDSDTFSIISCNPHSPSNFYRQSSELMHITESGKMGLSKIPATMQLIIQSLQETKT